MKSLEWYVKRLSLMSPTEIAFRIRDEVRNMYGRMFVRDFSPNVSLIEEERHWLFDMMTLDKTAAFLRENDMWDEEEAQDLIGHKFSFFSFDKKFIGKEIDWHRDYKNDRESPLKYCKHIDYQDVDEVGDYKYIWELNRHQHLISLAKAYYLTGKQEYKDEVKAQILSWIEQNPFMQGINWQNSLELGIRLIAWSWVWFFLGEIDEDFGKLWLECIYKHCISISNHFSYCSSANNHLIGEAAGLFIASMIWPFRKRSESWKKKSHQILLREIDKQNYEDGVNKEQAISYHVFVLDLFILAGLLGERNGAPFPESYWQRIEKMLEFIGSIMDKDGNVPNTGDSDGGFAVVLSDRDGFNPYRSLMATGAVMFKRGDFKSKTERFDEKSLWLFGPKGAEQFRALNSRRFIPKKAFDRGGYFVLSTNEGGEDEVIFILDCGPLGYLSLAAHGHADALSFTLSVGGKEFLIDPGTYAYQADKEWRDYFKGTAAHNTIRIDRENQSIVGGNFMWLRKAQSRLLAFKSNHSYDHIKTEHAGYARLSNSVIHQREVTFDKKANLFKIVDSIQTQGAHFIEQFFHFSKECTTTEIAPAEWSATNEDRSITIKVDKKLQTTILSGSTRPISGWRSERYDVKERTSTMVNSARCDGSCEFETLIVIE